MSGDEARGPGRAQRRQLLPGATERHNEEEPGRERTPRGGFVRASQLEQDGAAAAAAREAAGSGDADGDLPMQDRRPPGLRAPPLEADIAALILSCSGPETPKMALL